MATRRDKEKVIDEVWDDDRIRSFLQRGRRRMPASIVTIFGS